MSKFLFIAMALLAITLTPSSLTSSHVLAQAEEVNIPTTTPIYGKVCLHENVQYSLGDYVRAELGPTMYVVLRCSQSATEEIQWKPVKRSELNTSTIDNDPIFQETEQ